METVSSSTAGAADLLPGGAGSLRRPHRARLEREGALTDRRALPEGVICDAPAATSAAEGGAQFMDTAAIRFTQSSVKGTFAVGEP
jgi:hypothetical protein